MSPIRMASQSMVYYTVSGLIDSMYSPNLIAYENIIISYPELPDKLSNSTVAVNIHRLSEYDFQLGDKNSFQRDFDITIFVTADGYRDDVGQALFDHFKEAEIYLKNYNNGFPQPFGDAAEPETIGIIEVQKGLSMFPIYTYYSTGSAISQNLLKHVMRIQGVVWITYEV
jgi:hypothetical protein